jgi:Nitrate and nitrite sensing
VASDVQTLNSLALAQDQAAQQRALLYNAFLHHGFADGEQQALIAAQAGELIELSAFGTTATPAEQHEYDTDVAGTPASELASDLEILVQGSGQLEGGSSLAGINPGHAAATWYAAQSGIVDGMQQVELGVARNIVTRARLLQSRATDFALLTVILFAAIVLLTLTATISFSFSEKIDAIRRRRPGSSPTAL